VGFSPASSFPILIIVETPGGGGMSVVYKAKDAVIFCALKRAE